MKKKLLSVLAILLLVITFVAGCGKQSETPAMSEQGISKNGKIYFLPTLKTE